MNVFLQICLGITAVTAAVGALGILFVKAQKHFFGPVRTLSTIADDFQDPNLKEVITVLGENVTQNTVAVDKLSEYSHEAKHSLANGLQAIVLALDNMRKTDKVVAADLVESKIVVQKVAEDLAAAKTVVEGVATELAASQARADEVKDGEAAGAAADAASKSSIEDYRGRERRQSVEEWFAKDRRKREET